MFVIRPWQRKAFLVVAATTLLWRGWAWVDGMSTVEAASPPPGAASPTPAPVPALEAGLHAMRMGLTELRQAATTGEPAMLQEAEKDILAGLLDALDACVVAGAVVPDRYTRVVDAVAEVEGLFKYIPYVIEVEPQGDLPPIKLLLRRSPWPMVEARRGPWAASFVGGGVKLTPRRP